MIAAVKVSYLIADLVEFREVFVTIVRLEMPFHCSDIDHPIHQCG